LLEEIQLIYKDIIIDRISNKKFYKVKGPSVKKFLLDNGYDKDYGARPLKRAITTHIETTIAKFILLEKPAVGSVLKLNMDKKDNNKVVVKLWVIF